MKLLWILVCLVFSWSVKAGDIGGIESPSWSKEPTNGLVAILLNPAELGQGAFRRIRLVLDSHAQPSLFYGSIDDLPGAPNIVPDPKDPRLAFKTERDRVGAEAVIYSAYYFDNNWYYVKILRFPTIEVAKTYWQKRKKEGKSSILGSPAGNLLFTREGELLRPGMNARMNTIESSAGNYVVRLAPGGIGRLNHNPAIDLLAKQMEKIQKSSESAAGGNHQ